MASGAFYRVVRGGVAGEDRVGGKYVETLHEPVTEAGLEIFSMDGVLLRVDSQRFICNIQDSSMVRVYLRNGVIKVDGVAISSSGVHTLVSADLIDVAVFVCSKDRVDFDEDLEAFCEHAINGFCVH